MAIETATATATGATSWASYLVNGDASGLDDVEKAAADRWLEQQRPWYVVSDVEGSERFTWRYRLHTGLPFDGGSVVDYVLHKEE